MKLGVFSGTFDPVHKGHIWLAETARDELGLDELLFIPEPSPRSKKALASFEDRSKMIEIAISGKQKLSCLKADQKQHSVNGILQLLDQKYQDLDELWLVMGADVFEYLPKWQRVEDLLERAGFFVALKTEDDGEIVVKVKQQLGCRVRMESSPLHNVSSRTIRKNLTEGANNLDESVLSYIQENALYR